MTIDLIAAAIRIATPLLFAALGGLLSERSGVFAVGLEGMMLAGAFAAIVGAWATGSALGGVALAIVGGAIIATAVAVVAMSRAAHHGRPGILGWIDRREASTADPARCTDTVEPYRLWAQSPVNTL